VVGSVSRTRPDEVRVANRRSRDFPWTEVLIVGVLAMGAAAFVGFAIGWETKGGGSSAAAPTSTPSPSTTTANPPVDPAVAEGAHYFVQFACAQCHGIGGKGGVSPYVPALTSVSGKLTVAQLTSIIEHGLGESANPTRPYMPVWHGIISRRQISSLVDYIRAGLPQVPDATPVPVPANEGDVVAGAALYERYGCVNCHGPNGLGGVPNPSSPDKTIPPLSGAGFRTEFPPAKIAEIIRTGSVLGRAPIVSMPHWGGILTDQQVSQLIAYLNTLSEAPAPDTRGTQALLPLGIWKLPPCEPPLLPPHGAPVGPGRPWSSSQSCPPGRNPCSTKSLTRAETADTIWLSCVLLRRPAVTAASSCLVTDATMACSRPLTDLCADVATAASVFPDCRSIRSVSGEIPR
jgi:cbb3-type cytochrome c oxidase subunit III